jgi:hypothetical protein
MVIPKQTFLGKPKSGLLRPFVLSQILVGKPWDTFPESAFGAATGPRARPS